MFICDVNESPNFSDQDKNKISMDPDQTYPTFVPGKMMMMMVMIMITSHTMNAMGTNRTIIGKELSFQGFGAKYCFVEWVRGWDGVKKLVDDQSTDGWSFQLYSHINMSLINYTSDDSTGIKQGHLNFQQAGLQLYNVDLEIRLQQEFIVMETTSINKITLNNHTVTKPTCSFLPPKTLNNSFQEVIENVFYVYSAYLDERYDIRQIRIMGLLIKTGKNKITVMCNFTFENKTQTRNATMYEMCENHRKKFGGYIFSCEAPDFIYQICEVSVKAKLKGTKHSQTKIVTMGIIKQDAIYNKTNIGACIPPLFGHKIKAEQLVEFIEFNQILGATYFIFYDFNLQNSNISKILNYYSNKILLIPWKLPFSVDILKDSKTLEDTIWYHGQILVHNDCLYRSMGLLNYVTFIDLDEFIIPRGYRLTWEETLLPIIQNKTVGLKIKSVFFEPEGKETSPSETKLLTMNTLTRVKPADKLRTKVIVRPEKVFEVGIHHVSKVAREEYQVKDCGEDLVLIHHYRKCTTQYGTQCKPSITDGTAWKYIRKLKINFDIVMN
ncbi:hypothetical protein KUTeg_006801, partial [Tegillarca granosa]